MQRWIRRLRWEYALARRRPWRDWPGWLWFNLVKYPYWTYTQYRGRKLGILREGLPANENATRVRRNMLAEALPSRHVDRSKLH